MWRPSCRSEQMRPHLVRICVRATPSAVSMKGLPATGRWLRKPSLIWLRIPAGVLLIAGGLLSFLPILGLWMLPLGAMLLSDDLSSLRPWRTRLLDWMERHYPRWFAD